MDLANLSPKQLRDLSSEMASDDSRLSEFLQSLQLFLAKFPIDNGAFKDELYVLAINLAKTGVLACAGATRLAHVLGTIPEANVSAFLDGTQKDFAHEVRREMSIYPKTKLDLEATVSRIEETLRNMIIHEKRITDYTKSKYGSHSIHRNIKSPGLAIHKAIITANGVLFEHRGADGTVDFSSGGIGDTLVFGDDDSDDYDDLHQGTPEDDWYLVNLKSPSGKVEKGS